MPKCVVEQADERPDRAGRVVVLGLAEQERAAPLEVAQVDVVAERRADRLAAAVHRQHDFGLGIVPFRLRMDADLGADADRRHRRRLGEDLGVRSDADFEILRPGALRDQRLLDARRLVRSRAHVREIVADQRDERRAHRLGLRRIAARLLLDHALQHARHERDAARLDRLQVARREEPRPACRRRRPPPSWRASRRSIRFAAGRGARGSRRRDRRARGARSTSRRRARCRRRRPS